MPVRGVHTMFYSSEAEKLRQFLRDKIGLKATDVGGGWLIFDLPEADMGCHPVENGDARVSGEQGISFYCDDIEQTIVELKGKGVEFSQDFEDHGFGLVTFFKLPVTFRCNFINLSIRNRV